MLQIFVDGQQIDTGGVKFNLTLKNPLFIRDKLEGSYIYNFNIPATDRNKIIFDFPNRISRYSNNWIDLPCRILFNGHTIVDKSTISITETNINIYVANVKVGSGNIINLLKDKYLKDIDFGGDRFLCGEPFIPTDYYKNTALGSYPDYDFVVFPVQNTEFYKDTILDTDWKNNANIVNYYLNGSFQVDAISNGTFTPFPYVIYILKQIFESNGYKIFKNDFWNDPDLRKLVLYNNYADNITVNIPDPGPPITYTFTPKSTHKVNLQNQVPLMLVNDFINQLRFLGVEFFIAHNNAAVNILSLNEIINSTDYIEITNSSSPKIIGREKEWKGYKFSYSVDGDNWASKYFKNELDEFIIKDSVPDSLSLPLDENTEVNEIRLAEDIDTYFIFRWDENTSTYMWQYFCYHLEDLKQNTPDFEIKSDMSPLLNDRLIDINALNPGRAWLIPVIEEPGSNPYYLNSDQNTKHLNNPGLRLIFYRGMFADSLGGSYPLATNDVYDYGKNKISAANLSLKWAGEYGLYNKRFKSFVDFLLKTRPYEFQVIMSAKDISQFNFSKKCRIDGIDYLIKEIKTPISDRTIEPSTIECYKV